MYIYLKIDLYLGTHKRNAYLEIASHIMGTYTKQLSQLTFLIDEV